MPGSTNVEVLRNDIEHVKAQIEAVASSLQKQNLQVLEVRDAVKRMENSGYQAQISEVRDEARRLRDKVLVMETTTKIFAAGVAAGVSIIVGVLTFALAYFLHIPTR